MSGWTAKPSSMQTIDIETWHRRAQYRLYRGCADPVYELSFRIPVGDLVARSKGSGWSPFVVILAAVAASVNQVAPFRMRQRGDQVVLHDRVHPSWVVLGADGAMAFARGTLHDDLGEQLRAIAETTRRTRAAPSLDDPHGRDDVIYASSLAPLDLVAVRPERSGLRDDTVPRFFWGRVVDGKLSLTVSANHCFVDGMHVAELAECLEAALGRAIPVRAEGSRA